VGLGVRAGYLLDTNHLGLAVARGSATNVRLRELRKAGVRVGTIVPAICELELGVQYVREPAKYRVNLRQLLREIRLWPLDLQTATIYGRMLADLRRRGRVLSQVDVMLASVAEQMNLVLVTTDKDFDALPQIPKENWV
jgi:tRNA(fMet)-specific endonuclease VapC